MMFGNRFSRCTILLFSVLMGTGDCASLPTLPQYSGYSNTTVASAPIKVGLEHGVAEPVDSFAAALVRARKLRASNPGKTIEILFPPGVTRLAAPLTIGAADSGTTGADLRLRGAANGTTILSGAVVAFSQPALAGTLTVALGHPLTLTGYSYKAPSAATPNPLVFQGGWRIDLAAWPTVGYRVGWTLKQLPEGLLLGWPDGVAPPNLPSAMLVSGYILADWAYEVVRGIPRPDGVLLPGYHPSFLPKTPPRLRLLNVPENLTSGHMVLDEASGRLTLAPVSPIPVELAIAPTLLHIDGAQHINIAQIRFEKTTGTAIRINHAEHVTIDNCSVGLTGREGMLITDSRDVIVQRCVIRSVGGTGIFASAGDRVTLSPGGIWLRDNVIEQFGTDVRSYQPGVVLAGVGNRLEHSLIAVAPHNAVMLSGNDQSIETSEITAVACETDDVGAVYMGRDWTMRGMRIVGNFLHDIGGSSGQPIGVYLDDQFSGTMISNNVFWRMYWGVLIGGGRDNQVDGNVFAGMVGAAVRGDTRGLSSQRDQVQPGGLLMQKLMSSPYRTSLWIQRYPELARLPSAQPGAALGNNGSGNLLVGTSWLRSVGGFTMTDDGGQRSIVMAPMLHTMSSEQAWLLLSRLGNIKGERPGPRGRLMFDHYKVAKPNCTFSGM